MYNFMVYVFMSCFLCVFQAHIFSAGSAGGANEHIGEVQEYLLMLDEDQRDPYALHRVCAAGRSLDVVLIIEIEQRYNIVDDNGVALSVHRADQDGRLPIHYVIDREKEIFKVDSLTLNILLDQYGADPNYFLDQQNGDRYVEPALHYALRKGCYKSAALIVRFRNTDVTLSYHGQTPLQMAQDAQNDGLIAQIQSRLNNLNNN